MDPDAEAHLNDAVTTEFAAAGYTDDHIRTILDKQNQLKNNDTESHTWSRVHRRHVLPETLTTYQIPWRWDEVGDSTHFA
ncbi:hypothetical protein N7492_007221 [Penicillium capsulatum]|uniref:Uncharacterized protein n=1 Tax=Penicillium capsulatum TaxID=69766 RepID=A0A9W9I0W3_9EURO|nr:hypothetical protein N7492_007221 [Penicillium capsulatum]KAJ6117059.1 hypothetical protein N7512_006784 [Penicillium capsulatum]